jgi:hypothetical protein
MLSSIPSTKYSLGTPTRRPLTSTGPTSPPGPSALVASIGSCPCITLITSSASSTVLANGPIWSRLDDNAINPWRETRPYVGFNPTIPHSAAGWRIEPPVSDPRAIGANPAATATAEPPDEPPGTRETSHGFRDGP